MGSIKCDVMTTIIATQKQEVKRMIIVKYAYHVTDLASED